jgi:Chaperone of endosialidase
MNRLIQRKTTPPLLITLTLLCFALLPKAQAVVPPPDGGYPGGNTGEGEDALFSLTTGIVKTAIGFNALFSNTNGSSNTAVGSDALFSNISGSNNAAIGSHALLNNIRGSNNTATGINALFLNDTGRNNTATGFQALTFNQGGSNNTANGVNALFNNFAGINNTATGINALLNNTTGSFNIALGNRAGLNLTTGSHNIHIGNQGFADESAHIRIGTVGTHTATFIAGIRGVTVAGGVPVVVGTNGQLGTQTSSVRFKEAIKPMDAASEAIHALQPVMFHYKSDKTGTPEFGLIAEEVAEVNPDLVVHDENGEIYTVRYDAVNAMLLN